MSVKGAINRDYAVSRQMGYLGLRDGWRIVDQRMLGMIPVAIAIHPPDTVLDLSAFQAWAEVDYLRERMKQMVLETQTVSIHSVVVHGIGEILITF